MCELTWISVSIWELWFEYVLSKMVSSGQEFCSNFEVSWEHDQPLLTLLSSACIRRGLPIFPVSTIKLTYIHSGFYEWCRPLMIGFCSPNGSSIFLSSQRFRAPHQVVLLSILPLSWVQLQFSSYNLFFLEIRSTLFNNSTQKMGQKVYFVFHLRINSIHYHRKSLAWIVWERCYNA